MKSFVSLILAVFLLLQQTQALHFYLKTGEKKCFYEDLVKESLLVGKIDVYEYNDHSKDYFKNNNMRLEITVQETFDNDHQVLNQRASPSGDFTFTSTDSGEHKICIKPVYIDGTSGKAHRVFFDLAIGSAHDYVDSKSTKKVDALTLKVQQLNKKLEEIHWEQEQMRQREAVFRDQSENTNSRVVKWTFVQLFVLIGTCAYQLRHLKSFFVKQKIV